MFEREYEQFMEEQISNAKGQRKENLQQDLPGTKILLEKVLYPVFGTLNGLMLEYEMKSVYGNNIYADVYHRDLRIVFEDDSYVTHVELTTRNRHSCEKGRARAFAIHGYSYFPYSRDELEKKPEFCRQNLYELLGEIVAMSQSKIVTLPVNEREIIRFAYTHGGSFVLEDASKWLLLKKETCRKVVNSLEQKGLVKRVGGSSSRCYAFEVTDEARQLFYR